MGKRRYPPELVVLPVGTVVVLGLGAYLAGASQTVRYARVYGGPTDQITWHGRVEVWEEEDQVTRVVPGVKLEVVRSFEEGSPSKTATALLVTGKDGVSDFALDGHRGKLTVREPGALGVLTEGEPNLPAEVWEAGATSHGGRAPEASSGAVLFGVEVVPPVLSAPLGGELRVTADPEIELRYEFEGITPLVAPPTHGSEEQRIVIPFRTNEHAASVRVIGRTDQGEGTWFSSLAVIPGSFTFESTDAGFLVRSPVERERVYFTHLGPAMKSRGRHYPASRNEGGSMLLEPVGDGTSRGLIPKERFEHPGFGYLMLSSSVDGRSPATVGLPLHPLFTSTFEIPDGLWLDGGPKARRLAARESMKRRLVLGGYGALGGVVTILAFLFRVRQASREAEKALERAGAEPGVYRGDTLLGTLAVISLFFAFSLGVLWIVAR